MPSFALDDGLRRTVWLGVRTIPHRIRRGARAVLGLALPFLLLCASASIATSAQAACDPPRCLDVAVPVPSGLRVPDNTVRILLPAGYDAGSERYPVLYLLHGAGDTYATWTENTDVQAFTEDLPIII